MVVGDQASHVMPGNNPRKHAYIKCVKNNSSEEPNEFFGCSLTFTTTPPPYQMRSCLFLNLKNMTAPFLRRSAASVHLRVLKHDPKRAPSAVRRSKRKVSQQPLSLALPSTMSAETSGLRLCLAMRSSFLFCFFFFLGDAVMRRVLFRKRQTK